MRKYIAAGEEVSSATLADKSRKVTCMERVNKRIHRRLTMKERASVFKKTPDANLFGLHFTQRPELATMVNAEGRTGVSARAKSQW